MKNSAVLETAAEFSVLVFESCACGHVFALDKLMQLQLRF